METISFHFVICSFSRWLSRSYTSYDCCVGAESALPDHSAQRDQIVVEANREVQHVLTALGLGLDEHLFHRRHLLVQRLAGIDDVLLLRIVAECAY